MKTPRRTIGAAGALVCALALPGTVLARSARLMTFPDASGVPANMLPINDGRAFDQLKQLGRKDPGPPRSGREGRPQDSAIDRSWKPGDIDIVK